jgi:G3E family GTPase
VAVLVNDFGDINIDANLIAQVSDDGSVVSLTNGCVCCTLQDDLANTFERMSSLAIDHVLLEASGVALPDKLRAQCHYPGYFPHHCAVTVDAENYHRNRQDKYVGNLVQQQVLQADTLIITKLDLTDSFELPVSHAPSRANRADPSQAKQYSVTDPQLIYHLLEPVKDPNNKSGSSSDMASFSSCTLEQHRPIEIQELRDLLAAVPAQIERIKGFVDTPSGLQLIQKVGNRYSIVPADAAQNPNLVFIYPREAANPSAVLQANWKPWMTLRGNQLHSAHHPVQG